MFDRFTWPDGERTIHFGRGTLGAAREILGDGYVLLTTARASQSQGVEGIVEGASDVREVGSGFVEELSAQLLHELPPEIELIVALGGGRVIDTAKAISAGLSGLPRVAAIPTTLSAAEMTRVHRLPAGTPRAAPKVRPAIVINDPALSASQPPPELAASAANSLAHAVDGSVTTQASPVPVMAAGEAIRLTAEAYATGGDPDDGGRDRLALAALLSGYTIDSAWYGLHHVVAQTLVRVGGTSHGQANAVMLPHTAQALARRYPGRVAPQAIELARDLARRAGAERIRDLGVPHEALEKLAGAASTRSELALTPPPADRDELLGLYEAAW